MSRFTASLLLLFFVVASIAWAEPPGDEISPEKGAEMTDEEFDAFVDSAVEELSEKQERFIADTGLGSFARWNYDQKTGLLEFFDERDAKVLEMDVVQIGSYSHKSETWIWGWANKWVLPREREKAEPLRELAAITNFPMFAVEHAFELGHESNATSLAAVSVRHLGALGFYRAPTRGGELITYLAVLDFRWVQP